MGPLREAYYDFVLGDVSVDAVPLARRIAYRILADMTDRRGLRQQWEQIDDDIQEEIIAAWIRLAEEEIAMS